VTGIHSQARNSLFSERKIMWCHKILVAYDGSPASEKAIALAQAIASESPEVELVLVNIMRLVGGGMTGAGMDAVLADDAEAMRQHLLEVAANAANPTTVKVLSGTAPAELILRCVREEGCDLVIMGSRGKGGVGGYLGSVSYAVTKSSPVAVLITKEGDCR